MKLTITQNQIADQFVSLITQGVNAFVEAGKLIASAIDEHGDDIVEAIASKNPDITPEVIRRFEAVGRNQLFPMLLTSNAPGVRRLMKLPYSVQEQYASNPVPLVIEKTGGIEVLQVDVRNLTPDQSRQVFDRDGIRSESAQRAYIEDLKLRHAVPAKPDAAPYKVRKGKIQFSADYEFTPQELLNIVANLK